MICTEKLHFSAALMHENNIFGIFCFFFEKLDSELSFPQCVPLWIKNSTMCQILKWKLNDVSDFEIKILQRVRCWN